MAKKKKNEAILPAEQQRKTLHSHLNFAASEAYKLLRTNLQFTLPEKTGCKVLGVTSSVRSEGKSTTSINTAYVLAETGKKVLLIDGDMRMPSVAKKLEIENTPGLSNMFVSASGSKLSVVRSDILDNWYIMPAGDIPPNPSELLGSRRMKAILNVLTENFDYIIIDLPPVNIVTDALAVAPYLDGMIVVAREDYTSRKIFEDCIRRLELSQVKILGFVLNRAKDEAKTYGGKKYSKYYMD